MLGGSCRRGLLWRGGFEAQSCWSLGGGRVGGDVSEEGRVEGDKGMLGLTIRVRRMIE